MIDFLLVYLKSPGAVNDCSLRACTPDMIYIRQRMIILSRKPPWKAGKGTNPKQTAYDKNESRTVVDSIRFVFYFLVRTTHAERKNQPARRCDTAYHVGNIF